MHRGNVLYEIQDREDNRANVLQNIKGMEDTKDNVIYDNCLGVYKGVTFSRIGSRDDKLGQVVHTLHTTKVQRFLGQLGQEG